MVLILEVILEIQEILAVAQGHVIDALDDPAQIAVIGLEIGEPTSDLIHVLDHALVIEGGVIDLVHILETDTASTWKKLHIDIGVGNRLTNLTM